MEHIQPHDIIVMPNRRSLYSTYNEWVETNAPSYATEYKTQSYSGYFTDVPDVLSVICVAPHSKEQPKLLCLCRSLLADKLILVGAADTKHEDTPFDSCNKTIREMLHTEVIDRIYDTIIPRICAGSYPTPEQANEIKAAISSLFGEFNITRKEYKQC